jgi:hypothetical protein
VKEGLWTFKHPDRLTLEDGRELVRILKERGYDTFRVRQVLRDFLLSKGEIVGNKIAGGKPKSYGKFAKLKVPIETLNQMLEWIKAQNYEAFLVDKFMYETATRITATLNAKIENIEEYGDYGIVVVFDKGRKSIFPEGHKWEKTITHSLLLEIKKHIEIKTNGKIFNITKAEMASINMSAIKKFCPKLLEKFGHINPNHFWRHMFAQTMLFFTDWNTPLVANLGGWTVSALEESYGKPEDEQIRKWGRETIPKIFEMRPLTPQKTSLRLQA